MAFGGKRSGLLAAVLLAILLLGCILLWLYYPVRPRSAVGWILMFAIGVPTLAFSEWLAEAVLGAKIFRRLSSGARIALGVPVFLALLIVIAVIIWLGGMVLVRL
jgi:hypothetical protein